ncbi:MAG: serine hydrolase domain-containing protein [Thermomicrobiales bacterium]
MQARSAEKVSEALHHIDKWINLSLVKGAAAAVWQGGEIVAEHYAGEARPGVTVNEQTIFPLASVTKPVTAAEVMVLVEWGQIALDEAAYRHVPAFVAASPHRQGGDARLESARRSVTVRHLLSHTAGLPEDLPQGQLRYEDKNDAATIANALIELPLFAEPGTELRYSNAGFALLGRLIERLTQNAYAEQIQAHVLHPLEMKNTVVRPGEELAERIVHLDDAVPDDPDVQSYNSPYWRSLGIPWGGLYGTPVDLARFAASFLNGGPRLLSAASVREMTTDQVRELPGEVQSMRTKWDTAAWGLGWEVKGSKRNHWTGDLTSPRTFCHIGAAGTLLWADPEYEIAFAVFANRTLSRIWGSILPAWQRLSNAVIAAST